MNRPVDPDPLVPSRDTPPIPGGDPDAGEVAVNVSAWQPAEGPRPEIPADLMRRIKASRERATR